MIPTPWVLPVRRKPPGAALCVGITPDTLNNMQAARWAESSAVNGRPESAGQRRQAILHAMSTPGIPPEPWEDLSVPPQRPGGDARSP